MNIILTKVNLKEISMNKIFHRMNSKTLNKINKVFVKLKETKTDFVFKVKSMRF